VAAFGRLMRQAGHKPGHANKIPAMPEEGRKNE